MFHPKHALSSLKNIGKMNFKSIVWFIKAINIYIYVFFVCFVLFWVFFVGLFFFCLVFVFVVGTISFFFQFVVGFG